MPARSVLVADSVDQVGGHPDSNFPDACRRSCCISWLPYQRLGCLRGLRMFALGRFLQMVGLFVLPLAILMNLFESLTLGQSLAFSGFGITAFCLGYVLQGLGDKGGQR